MATVHEDMQQGTGKQEQPRQPFQSMRPVFTKQEKPRNRRETN